MDTLIDAIEYADQLKTAGLPEAAAKLVAKMTHFFRASARQSSTENR